jgi:hypothetical protein
MLEGYYYQDRTAHISLLENAGKQLIFIRPRRFGKSLLLSMLGYYYDVNYTQEFETLFGSLAIGKNPTSSHNQYLIMKWDFSLIKSTGGIEDIEQAIHQHINDRITSFAYIYKEFLENEVVIHPSNAISSLESLFLTLHNCRYKTYLLIDEYDNFANEVLTTRNTEYKALLHGEGLLKTVFKAVKAAASGQGLDRVFITGVSPVVLSDMTSGYNVAKSIYLESEFNTLCGFTESEIAQLLEKIAPEKAVEALDTMRTFYNGYCFSEQAENRMYNPTLSLYFLEYLQKKGQYPSIMLDENLSMDRNKLVYISQLPHGEEVLIKALSGGDSVVIPQLARRFGVEDMLTAVKDETFMVSLMYYFGILTLAGRAGAFGKWKLKIPNLVAKQLYVERLQELLLPTYEDKQEISTVAETFCLTGNLQPLCDFLETRYFPILSNRDYRWSNELIIKIAFMTLLFNDNIYMMLSETEADRGYVDLSLIVRPDMRRFQALDLVLEFKYIGLKELGMTGSELKTLSREELADLPLVKLKLNEATIQAKTYTASLSDRYQLNGIRAFSVVALGFERVVWLETN